MELKIYNPQEEGFLKEIDWNYEELKTEIQGKANDYMNLVYTADQVKDAKKDRANLNKFVEALESKRKEIPDQLRFQKLFLIMLKVRSLRLSYNLNNR